MKMTWQKWRNLRHAWLKSAKNTSRSASPSTLCRPRLPPPSTPAATCFKQPLTEASDEQIWTVWIGARFITLDSWFMWILLNRPSLKLQMCISSVSVGSCRLHFIVLHCTMSLCHYVTSWSTLNGARFTYFRSVLNPCRAGLWALGPRKDWTTAMLSSSLHLLQKSAIWSMCMWSHRHSLARRNHMYRTYIYIHI